MKTLKQVLEAKTEAKPQPLMPVEPDSVTSYVPKTKDEKRFYDKHVVQKTADRNGNGDDVFAATNVKAYNRTASRHGYNAKDDQQVYEARTLKAILEKHLTPAEMKKREEIAKAMEREHPGMDKSKKMAIATSAAKRAAEETDMFAAFAEDLRPALQEMYDALNEENKQAVVDLIEAEEYHTLIDIMKEVTNA